jgi:2',5'-phosphodiesterase
MSLTAVASLQPTAFRLLRRVAPRSSSASVRSFASLSAKQGAQTAWISRAHPSRRQSFGFVLAAAAASSRDVSHFSSSVAFAGSRVDRLSHARQHRRAFATSTIVMASSETHDARVVTYNVLSSSLCEPTYFTHCAPEDLDPPTRLKKTLVKLEDEMKKGAVIALQEVSQKWAGELHVFFAKRGYHLVSSLYGKPFNGYMGIALAVPIDKYDVVKVDISRCSDTKRLPRAPKPSKMKELLVDKPLGLYYFLTGKRAKQSDWALARNRFNTIMYATLKCKSSGVEFGVANYHMPCMFRDPRVMTIHSQLAAAYAQKMAGSLPVVLMGDFNLKPGDGGYDLITTGDIDAAHEAAPVAPDGETWSTALTYPMRSAYHVATGSEPDFTNFAQIKDDPQFIDTLDYIFISPTVDVAEVMPLPHRSEVKGPFPSAVEPSDHILLAATVRVPGK